MDTEKKSNIGTQQNRYDEKKVVMHISKISITANFLLAILKFFAGFYAHSSAMISDAVHSASDVFSTIIVMVGVNMANKASDEDHQYGHERLESIASIILANVLFFVGLEIGIKGFQKIFGTSTEPLSIPGTVALVAAVLSIAVKEWMYWFTRAGAKKIGSSALMADAWHHRSDSLSSIGSFIGILGARMGFPLFDPIASIVICIFIGKASFDIFKDAINQLVDKSCDSATTDKMRLTILKQNDVIQIDLLQSRLFGSKIYVDIEIGVDGTKTLKDSHAIAESVHTAIEHEFPRVKHCMVHVNPIEPH